jgi:TonB family protein
MHKIKKSAISIDLENNEHIYKMSFLIRVIGIILLIFSLSSLCYSQDDTIQIAMPDIQDVTEETPYQYYALENPPLFYDAKNKEENKSKIEEYIANEIAKIAIKDNGNVFISCIIDKNGRIKSAEILRSVNPELDKIALKIIEDMPDWTPGEKNGEKVNVSYMIGVKFK